MRQYTKKKPVSTRQVAEKALSIARKAVSTEETKFNEIGPISATLDNTSDVSLVTAIPVGTGPTDRIGNKINVIGFNFNYWFVKGSGAAALARIVLVHDTQQVSDSTGPGWTDVFSSTQTHGLRNMLTTNKRYKVIYDQCHALNAAYPSTSLVKKFISFKHPVLYNGTASSDIQKNGVYLLTQCNEATASAPLFLYNIRTLYKDS